MAIVYFNIIMSTAHCGRRLVMLVYYIILYKCIIICYHNYVLSNSEFVKVIYKFNIIKHNIKILLYTTRILFIIEFYGQGFRNATRIA